jgi:hypothetical protein
MFAEGEAARYESDRMAAQRIMAYLDEQAAQAGMAISGEVTIAATEPHPLTGSRTMRLEADVATR